MKNNKNKKDFFKKQLKKETQCLHSGYKPANGEPMALPVYQSTTFCFDSTREIGDMFDLKAEGHMYSRISNPTVECFEKKLAEMEGGGAAVCTVSGQSAIFIALFNLLSCGDHFISGTKIYGGTTNLFAVTMKRMGIDCTFVDFDGGEEEIQKAFRPNTRAVFGETLSNPALAVLDIEKMAAIAHKNKVPLIVDNTFPTPVLCNPISYGADIVVHSTTKYLDGHAVQVGGAVIDSGRFDWESGGFDCFTSPDASYHGVVYTKTFGALAYAARLRACLVRDIGLCPPALSAFLTDLGSQTLGIRMRAHSSNALAAAKFFERCGKIQEVIYPGLESNKYHALAKKYLPKGQSGVLSVVFGGGREAGVKFMDSLRLAKNVVHVADVRTLVLHPASETHRQLDDKQLALAGISPGLVRISVGIEDIEDILADFEFALGKVD